MECGWDHKFIASNFTLSQIRAYYKNVQEIRAMNFGIMFEGMMYANAASNGGIKIGVFNDYVGQFLKRKKKVVDSNKTIEEMKRGGLPIEDR